MKRIFFLLKLAAVTPIPALIMLLSCKPQQPEDAENLARRAIQPQVMMVKTITLQPSTFYHEIVSNGKVHSLLRAAVPFRVAGLIEELYVSNGQKINKGELMAVIEDFEYKTALITARQALEKAEIEFKDDLLTRYMTTDTNRLEPQKIKTSRIRSGLNDALIALSRAEYQYEGTRIHAPFDGVIADLEAAPHNHSQNYKNLCNILSNDVMYVEFPVMESEYGFVTRGMPVILVPFIDNAISIDGRITQINPQADDNGMVNIRAEFRNNGRLIDGMNVRVLIRKPELNKLAVPKEALVIRQGRDVIFIREDSLAIWKYVTIESENSSMVSISEGLTPGDRVIVTGNTNLAHETKVIEE